MSTHPLDALIIGAAQAGLAIGMVAKHPDRAEVGSGWPPKRIGEGNCICAMEVKPSNTYPIEATM